MIRVEEKLHLGLEAHQAGLFPEAEAHYQNILDSHPDHAATNHAMGLLRRAQNQPAKAVPFLRTALQDMSDVEHLWFDCLDALIEAECWRESLNLVQSARSAGLAEGELDNREMQILPHIIEQNISALDCQVSLGASD